jgi:hypothetical protein
MKKMAFLAALAAVPFAANATVLTFADLGLGNGGAVPQDFGDNVAGAGNGYEEGFGWTPNVAVEWDDQGEGSQWVNFTSGWSGGLTDSIYWEDPYEDGTIPDPFGFTFTAEEGWFVVLHGMDMPDFGVEITGVDLMVKDGEGNVLVDSDPEWNASVVEVNFEDPIVATELSVEFDVADINNTGYIDWFGVDNISFSQQPVPEPATMLALGAGLAALAARRRKK